jgi:hypothetical protein
VVYAVLQSLRDDKTDDNRRQNRGAFNESEEVHMTNYLRRVGTVVAAITLTSVAASAASVTISDLFDGNPTVTPSADLLSVVVTLSPERAVITALLPTSVNVVTGTRSVIMLEPAGDPFGPRQSDFLTLTIGAAAPTVGIIFESDGFPTFQSDIAQLPTGTPTLLEDGTVQDASSLLNSGAFTISLQSDPAGPELPEPGTWLLLATGLSSIGLARRKVQISAASLRPFPGE